MEDNITVNDIFNFARRQGKVFLLVFAIVFAVGGGVRAQEANPLPRGG